MSTIRFALVALVLVGCGGSIATPTGDGGTDSSPNPDGSSGSVCPTSPPAPSSACSTTGPATCEYGTNPDPSCNQLFACTNGSWVDETNGGLCAPQSDCPTSYASVPVNQDCAPNQLSCAYPQGECICTTSMGGLQKMTPSWECFPAQSGCPSPRPDIGSPCSGTQQLCDYGSCSGGVALSCVNGAWQEAAVLCPQ